MKLAYIALATALTTLAQVRFEDIRKGPGDNWLTYGDGYADHSALDRTAQECTIA